MLVRRDRTTPEAPAERPSPARAAPGRAQREGRRPLEANPRPEARRAVAGARRARAEHREPVGRAPGRAVLPREATAPEEPAPEARRRAVPSLAALVQAA